MHNCISIKKTKDGVIITIFVKPNAPKFKVELEGDEIVVYSTEEPVKGKVKTEISLLNQTSAQDSWKEL